MQEKYVCCNGRDAVKMEEEAKNRDARGNKNESGDLRKRGNRKIDDSI